MATTIGKLSFLVSADSSGVRSGLLPGMSALQGMQSTVAGMVGGLSALLGGVTIAGAGGWGVKLASDAEQAKIAFEVLLGSGEKATKMLGELRNLANKSPLELTDVREGARLLLNFGVAQEAILPSLGMLGDVSGGNADKMNRLALAFGQSASAGRLMGQDLLQMINAGFNPLQEISKRTGESMAELKKRMEAGGVSSQEVVQAFQDATSEGGRFFGMMDRQSETLAGRFSTLKDNVAMLFTEMGEKLLPTLKSLTETGIKAVEWLQNLDAGTVQSTVSIVAMTAAFGASIAIVPKIIAAGAAIVKTLRAIAVGQSITQALAGPKGWATLAVGLVAAAGAGLAVNAMFDGVGSAAETTSAKVKETRKDISGLFNAGAGENAGEALKDRLKALGEEAKEVKKKFDDMRKAIEGRRGVFTGIAERFASGTAETLAKAGQESIITRELRRINELEQAALKRIEDATKEVEAAIEKKPVIQVTERRV